MLTKWTKYAQNESSSYSRPITVNVYFKSENPPPGYYDGVDRPKTQSYQTGHRHLFTSKCKRGKVKQKDVPDVGAYDPEMQPYDFQPSAVFMGPTEKKKVKINLYDPMADPPKDIGPGPGDYFDTSKDDANTASTTKYRSSTIGFETGKQNRSFTNAFQVSNLDRFGRPIQNKTPIDVKPPPGAYDINLNNKKKIVSYSMGKIMKSSNRKRKFKAPGPAYYKPLAEPKATSYHLNVQNMWMC